MHTTYFDEDDILIIRLASLQLLVESPESKRLKTA